VTVALLVRGGSRTYREARGRGRPAGYEQSRGRAADGGSPDPAWRRWGAQEALGYPRRGPHRLRP